MSRYWMAAVFMVAIMLIFQFGGSTILEPHVSLDSSDSVGEETYEDTTALNASLTHTDETEYWALMVAVGIYKRNPDMDRPTMLVEVERFHDTLLVSEHWQEDHIKVITKENATVFNIVNGLRWLDEMEDENDVCLVYLTTHGFPILWDLPPFDEEDGMDEALAAYNGFLPFPNPWSWEPLANPFAIVTDDMFNALFNRLESQALGVVVDSCHSGGFNDNWSYSRSYDREVNWVKEFAGELEGRNRVVVTSVPAEETSYGSYFAHYIIDGLKGYGDDDDNGKVSLEEAFYFAREKIEEETSMRPQIFDDYPGELELAEIEMPPSSPTLSETVIIGNTNTVYEFNVQATDPENHNIRYTISWGDGIVETTGWTISGEEITLTHSWTEEGTYDISAKAEDERGAESEWSTPHTVTMADDGHVVDQRQVNQWWLFGINNTRWLAQSFIPTIDTLDKLEVSLAVWESGYDATISLRESLDGTSLSEITITPEPTGWDTTVWVDIDVPEIGITPGEPYYIVCSNTNEDWGIGWSVGADNPYKQGTFYLSEDGGTTWNVVPDRYKGDACFVTYG